MQTIDQQETDRNTALSSLSALVEKLQAVSSAMRSLKNGKGIS